MTFLRAAWAFHDAGDFREVCCELSDDADTTGAVCGQLAGAYWGEAGISMANVKRAEKSGGH